MHKRHDTTLIAPAVVSLLAFTLAPPLGILLASASTAHAQFGTSAPLPGDMGLAPSAGNQATPHVAAGAAGFLAVWEDDASSIVDTVLGQQAFGSSVPGNHDIHGMLLDLDGNRILDAPIVIDHGPWDQLRPRVAWNGSEYLVVFESTHPTSSFYTKGIYGVRVSASGQVLDAAPFLIYDAPGFDETMPIVASAGGDWLVAWLDLDPLTQLSIVSGRIVTSALALGPRRTLVSGASGSVPSELDLAAAGGRYALLYGLNYGGNVRVRLFDAAASAVAPAQVLATSGNRPGIAASASGFYAAWFGSFAFRGTTIDLNGAVGTAGGAVLAPPALNNSSVLSVGYDGAAFTVGFTSLPDVYVVRVDGAGTPLGAATSITTTPTWLSQVAVAGAQGRTHVLWTDTRATPNNFGIDPADVWRATLDGGGNVIRTDPISVSPPAQFGARIAGAEATGFVVVFNSYSGGVSRIVAQRLDALGNAVSPEPFEVLSADRTLVSFDVAWNGSEFLCVWGRLRSMTSSGTPSIVEYRRFRADGTFLDPAPVPVMEGDIARVDAVGSTFLVAAHFHHPVLQSNHIVRHRRVAGGTGQFLDPAPVQTSVGELGDLVGLADRWLVTRSTPTGCFVDLNGVAGALTYYGPGQSMRVARNAAGTEALLAYEWRDQSGIHTTTNIRTQRVALDGTALDPQLGPLVSSAANAQLRPVGVALGDEYTFVWADHRAHPTIEPGLGDVYACRMDRNLSQLDPQGLPLLATPNAEGSVELFASGAGRAIFAASAIERSGPHAGVHRVRTASYTAGPIGAIVCIQPAPNSSGLPGAISAHGSTLAADRALRLTAQQLPHQALTFFLVSRTLTTPTVPPASQGVLCLGGNVGRFVGPGQILNSGPAGAAELDVDSAALPTPFGPVAVNVGETWVFQAWHRDSVGGAATSNFTSALAVTFR
ncbi:MAG: hypothetical protein R3F49_06180 [Planctomycetota bacterium]